MAGDRRGQHWVASQAVPKAKVPLLKEQKSPLMARILASALDNLRRITGISARSASFAAVRRGLGVSFYEFADGVMTLILQRPEKKNALCGAMYDAMSDAVRQADGDASVRAILFQGDGDSFTAGNDMADFAHLADDENSAESPVHQFIDTISNANKPLIAAVQGNAVGIGTTMLLHFLETGTISTVVQPTRCQYRGAFAKRSMKCRYRMTE